MSLRRATQWTRRFALLTAIREKFTAQNLWGDANRAWRTHERALSRWAVEVDYLAAA